MKKTFNTNKEMIVKLQKRGLIINDESDVFVFNNYVNLIYIYSRPFYDPKNEKYTRDINVKELIKINKIDIKIQSALFSRIMIIEGKIRTVLAAQIARELNPIGHKQIKNYNTSTPANTLNRQIKKMKKYDKRFIQSNKKIITPNKMYHQSLPIWLGVEGYELGQLQFIYNNIESQEIKRKIASHFHIGSSNMNKFINVIREWRNIVAHKNTLFERSIKPRISSGKSVYLWEILQIPKCERVNFSNNLTALMIVFNAFLSKVELKSLLNEMRALLIGHSNSKKWIISFDELCFFFGLHIKLFENF